MILRLFRRLRALLFGRVPVRQPGERLSEPRGRVVAGEYRCGTCRRIFRSFVELRSHVCPGHASESPASAPARPRAIAHGPAREETGEGGLS